MFGSVFKPSQEIERFTNIAAMIKLPCDRRQVPYSFGDMMGFFLKNVSTFILGQIPPSRRFSNRNKGRQGRFRSTQGSLIQCQFLCSGRSTYRTLLITPDKVH